MKKYEYVVNELYYSTYHFADETGKMIDGDKYERINQLVDGEILVPLNPEKTTGWNLFISRILEINEDKEMALVEGYLGFVRGSIEACFRHLDSRTDTPVLEKVKKIINIKKREYFDSIEDAEKRIIRLKNGNIKKMGERIHR